jgi:hypothetical protein
MMTGYISLDISVDTYVYHSGYKRYVWITVWISKQRSYIDKFPKKPITYPGYPWISMIIQGYPKYPDISAGSKFPDEGNLGRSAVRQVRRVICRRVEALKIVYVWNIQLLQPPPESSVVY